MKECGYCLTVEHVAEATNARPDDTSSVGFSFDSDALARFYQHMGLEIVRVFGDRGPVQSGKCKICHLEHNKVTAPNGTRIIQCDPEKHAAYYNALEIR